MNPTKEVLYILAIVVLVAGLVFAYAAGRQADSIADERVAHAQEMHNQEVENLANSKAEKLYDDFKIANSKPPVDIPSIVCVAPKASSNVPANSGTGKDPNAKAGSTGKTPQGFNPAPAVLKDGVEAQATIDYLQGYILICQNAGLCKK